MTELEPVLHAPLEIEILEVIPSFNRLVRMHWATRRALLKKWQWLVWLEVLRSRPSMVGPFTEKVQVKITRYSHKTLDPDNLHGSAKIILDALRAAKVLVDDTPAHIALICEQIKGAPRTVIRVTPINASADLSNRAHEGAPVLEPSC